MSSLRILYLGEEAPWSTSRHRADALRRLGHIVDIFNPFSAVKDQLGGRIGGALHFRTGYRFLQPAILRWLETAVLPAMQADYDLIWINGGELLGKRCVERLRQAGRPLVSYSNDDPTGGRDGHRFDQFLAALPLYDLCVVVRPCNETEFLARGARAVLRVFMSCDEVAHSGYADPADIPEHLRSDVLFAGTWMRGEGRDKFLLELIEAGLDVAIFGDRWQKSPNWQRLARYWRGPALKGRDYVGALQGAKVALGLLSKGNRDQHTTRSVEIPWAGGLLCAERTEEHCKMYREDIEAVFWADSKECILKCRELLQDDARRESIRAKGMARVREGGFSNQAVCGQILERLGFQGSATVNAS